LLLLEDLGILMLEKTAENASTQGMIFLKDFNSSSIAAQKSEGGSTALFWFLEILFSIARLACSFFAVQ
jgi:hypothetical protein